MRGIYNNIKYISKLGTVALVALICVVVSMIVGAVLAIPIFGQGAFSAMMSGGLTIDEGSMPVLKYFQLIQSVGLFVIPAFILAYLFDGRVGRYLQINKKPFVVSVILATVVVMSASPLINMVGLWNMGMELPEWLSSVEQWMREKEDAAKELTEFFVYADSGMGLFYNIILIGLIPAVGEELLFRGVIQRVFHDWTKNKHAAIWISAILFSALHMQFYGFIPRVILGAMFGYLLIWSGNMWLPIIAHFVNNSTAVIAYYLYGNEVINVDPDSIGTNTAYGLAGILSLIVVCVLFYYLYKYEKKRNSTLVLVD